MDTNKFLKIRNLTLQDNSTQKVLFYQKFPSIFFINSDTNLTQTQFFAPILTPNSNLNPTLDP